MTVSFTPIQTSFTQRSGAALELRKIDLAVLEKFDALAGQTDLIGMLRDQLLAQ